MIDRELFIDGVSVADGWSLTGADNENDPEVKSPYYVFDADAQENIAGPADKPKSTPEWTMGHSGDE